MDNMRYDHTMMADHKATQAQLVAHLDELRTQALNVLQSQLAPVWTEHGSNAYQAAHLRIDQAYQRVFETVQRHGIAIGQASANALTTDLAAASSFNI